MKFYRNNQFLAMALLIVSLILASCAKTDGKLTVTTKPIAEITSVSAKSGGNVTASGDVSVEVSGVCWSESPNPTINDFFTTDNQGVGEYISFMKNLRSGTKYYVRAYASTSSGVMYGEEKDFTTLSEGGGNNGGGNGGDASFSVSTHGVTEITFSTAMCGGVVTCNGDMPVTARGVCWSTSPNPTVDQYHTTDGQGAGSFTSNMTGLSANTKYYVRAYAQSNSQTVYGMEMNFTTNEQPQAPTVTVTLINVTPTYLELKFEPSNNTSYYCYNVGSTLTSTSHHTGVTTKKIEQYQNNYFQPDTEYEFTIVAYGMDGTAGEVNHPKFKTSPSPYPNYLRVYNKIYPLYTATIRHSVSSNPNYGYKEIFIGGDDNWVLLQYVCYYYEIDNVWYSGVYTMNGGDVHQYNCIFYANGFDEVDNGSTFSITKSGNMTTYDLYGNQGAGKGCVTAHFVGVPTY
ncbi:MAG: fibronectin type III domain-containing protein [Bacteroidales bacterium]|nr:fibronectin type III domain-containing protein [Bacteroidales bacterium]